MPRPLETAYDPSIHAREVSMKRMFVLNALAGGAGGNTSVFVTATGVVVVDTKNPGWGQPLLEVIKTRTR